MNHHQDEMNFRQLQQILSQEEAILVTEIISKDLKIEEEEVDTEEVEVETGIKEDQ